jgi:hypothetical protein
MKQWERQRLILEVVEGSEIDGSQEGFFGLGGRRCPPLSVFKHFVCIMVLSEWLRLVLSSTFRGSRIIARGIGAQIRSVALRSRLTSSCPGWLTVVARSVSRCCRSPVAIPLCLAAARFPLSLNIFGEQQP